MSRRPPEPTRDRHGVLLTPGGLLAEPSLAEVGCLVLALLVFVGIAVAKTAAPSRMPAPVTWTGIGLMLTLVAIALGRGLHRIRAAERDLIDHGFGSLGEYARWAAGRPRPHRH